MKYEILKTQTEIMSFEGPNYDTKCQNYEIKNTNTWAKCK